MPFRVLISDPSEKWVDLAKQFLGEGDFEVDVATNGKDAQLKIYNEKFHGLILDIDTVNNSGPEVLKYARLNASFLKVILTVDSQDRLEELEITPKALLSMGASDVLIKPYSTENLLRSLDGDLQYALSKHVKNESKERKEETEFKASDDEFTSINIKDFFSGNISIFDLFIRMKSNRYLKILHRGDYFDVERLKKYKEDGIKLLYFKTKDRGMYIRYMSNFAQKILSKSRVPTGLKVKAVRNVSEKFIEQVYVEGIKPQFIEEGKKICENVHQLITKNEDLYKHVKKLENEHPSVYAHSFLVLLFSSIVCNNLEWASKGTIDKVSMGAMFHDIGKLKLPEGLMGMDISAMTEQQKEEYETHPTIGLHLLSNFPDVTEPVRQIVFQHHELLDGTGFPRGIVGGKLFPLAQIVGLVDLFVNEMTKNQLTPAGAMKVILQKKSIFQKYNGLYIKALLKALIKSDIKL